MGGLEARACAGGSRPFVSVQCRALQCTRKSAPPHSAFFDQTRIQRAEREKKMNDGWWERGLCSAGRVWESNVIGPLLGLPQYNIFWVGGRGGVPVDVEGRGEMEGDHCQLSNLVRPRGFIVHPSKPPSPRHSQHYLSNLPCCCSPSPVPSPSRPPPPNHRAAHPNPIFRSRCCRPPTLPTFPLPPQQPSTEPRQIRPGRTCLPGPNHYSFDSHLASLDVFPTPITYPPSWTPRTRRPCRLCCWVAAVLHRGTDLLDRDDPIHAQTRPKTHTPYQA